MCRTLSRRHSRNGSGKERRRRLRASSLEALPTGYSRLFDQGAPPLGTHAPSNTIGVSLQLAPHTCRYNYGSFNLLALQRRPGGRTGVAAAAGVHRCRPDRSQLGGHGGRALGCHLGQQDARMEHRHGAGTQKHEKLRMKHSRYEHHTAPARISTYYIIWGLKGRPETSACTSTLCDVMLLSTHRIANVKPSLAHCQIPCVERNTLAREPQMHHCTGCACAAVS